jgi:hypothetical protein
VGDGGACGGCGCGCAGDVIVAVKTSPACLALDVRRKPRQALADKENDRSNRGIPGGGGQLYAACAIGGPATDI